ncbi:unnamed protein product [Scytosiphon promiscuus]
MARTAKLLVWHALAWGTWANLFSGAEKMPMGGALKKRTFRPAAPEPLPAEQCPESCGDAFGRQGKEAQGGSQRIRSVQVQERGEPKSGTGFMFEWATNALAHSCMYLQRAYGGRSCRIEWNAVNRTMIFDPSLAAKAPGPCPCYDMEMVVYTLTNLHKHKLPVQDNCGFAHFKGVPSLEGKVCTNRSGREPKNHKELVECVQEAACPVVDDRLQMSVMRDPRPVAVSMYYHMRRVHPEFFPENSVDKYALDLLPAICQWVSIRYHLFTEILGQKSSLFWYNDAQENPEEWHNRFYDFVGLRMPAGVIANSTAIATGQASDDRLSRFPSKGTDAHVDGNNGGDPPAQKMQFRDEISPATLSKMDDVLRVWLPPVLLERLEIS